MTPIDRSELARGAERRAFRPNERAGTMGNDESGPFDTRRPANHPDLSPRTLDGHRVSSDMPALHRFRNRARHRRSDLDAGATMRRATATAKADRQGGR